MGQRSSAATELLFEELFVPDERVIGGLGNGWALNRAVLNYSRAPVAALALGMARSALEEALGFCRRTRLGGRPLVAYQQVRLRLAEMWSETVAMRSMIWHACNERVPRQLYSSASKFQVSDRAMEICAGALDLLGNAALGHNRVEKAWRDARLTRIYEGTNQINRLAVWEAMVEFERPSADAAGETWEGTG